MKNSLVAFALALSMSGPAFASPDPDRVDEAFEGVYDLVFDCTASHKCPAEAGVLKKLVILGTSKPSLLGSGLGWVVTILNPNTGPAFSFSGATYDAAAYTIHGNSSGGYGGQIADLILVMDPITGELKGSLDDSLSPGELTFVAKPVRTVGTFFQASGDPSPAASIEGQYSGKWANYPSEILLKDFGTAGFAGKLAILGSSPIETSFHGGLLEESKGFLTLVGGSNGALLKIFVANHGGTWTGFSVSAEYGKVSELTLKKSAP